MSWLKAALSEAINGHAYTYPDSFCECGAWVDDYRSWRDHNAEVIAPVVERLLASPKGPSAQAAPEAVSDPLEAARGTCPDHPTIPRAECACPWVEESEVGICGDRWTSIPGAILTCALPAGHLGAHHEKGTSWKHGHEEDA